MAFFIGTDVEFDDDESDALEVPRMVSDESDPVDLVRGRGDTLGVSVIVSFVCLGCGFCMYWYRGSTGTRTRNCSFHEFRAFRIRSDNVMWSVSVQKASFLLLREEACLVSRLLDSTRLTRQMDATYMYCTYGRYVRTGTFCCSLCDVHPSTLPLTISLMPWFLG
jgi:hypothetical protein